MRAELTAERLRELLHYDPETGVFTWRVARVLIAPGSVAGSPDWKGYVCIKIDSRLYKAHRLAWLYVHGVWPAGQIDHINRVKSDNSLSNLRDVSQSVNQHNRREARRDNSGELLGATRAYGGKWRARIVVDGRVKHIGTFNTPEEAHQAYLAAKRKLHEGYTI